MRALILLFVLGSAGSSHAQDTRPDEVRVDFVRGNAYFILLHEFAHAIISDHGIPVLGNEEDAADTLAASVLLKLDQRLVKSSDGLAQNVLLLKVIIGRIGYTTRVRIIRGILSGNVFPAFRKLRIFNKVSLAECIRVSPQQKAL